MSDMRELKCREHGGKFAVPVRRGRPPVRCTEEHPCDAQRVGTALTEAGKAMSAVAAKRNKMKEIPPVPTRQVTKTPAKAESIGVAAAKAAKVMLETQGWSARGKAWISKPDKAEHVSVTATRGEEMVYLIWINGALADQQYSLWNVEKPSANGKPASKLPFDPDEVADAELVQLIIGTKVTWWNKLAGKEEHATAGRDHITVEHSYSATGDETPGARIVKFVDAEGQGYRAFRLDALLKIGKA